MGIYVASGVLAVAGIAIVAHLLVVPAFILGVLAVVWMTAAMNY